MGWDSVETSLELYQEVLSQDSMHSLIALQLLSLLAQTGPCITTDSKGTVHVVFFIGSYLHHKE